MQQALAGLDGVSEAFLFKLRYSISSTIIATEGSYPKNDGVRGIFLRQRPMLS